MFISFRAIFISFEEKKQLLDKVGGDSSFKGAAGRTQTEILYLNQKVSKDLRHNHNEFIICKDVVITIPVVVYTRKDFYLLDELNLKIGMIKSAGLINFWYSQDIQVKTADQKASVVIKALTIHDLMGCFQILVFGLIVSFIAFGFELILYFCKFINARKLLHM